MKSWKIVLVAAVMLFSVGVCTDALAQVQEETFNYNKEEPRGYENLWSCMSRKLGRGVSNVAFGVLEVPIYILDYNFDEGGIAAVTAGTIGSIGYFLVREFVGLFEIITFPFPLPNCPNDEHGAGAGYGPILRPEWIITPQNNLYNFVYPKSTNRM